MGIPESRPLLVAIGGCSRSGKSVTSKLLLGLLDSAVLIQQDDYFDINRISALQTWEKPECLDLQKFASDIHKAASNKPKTVIVEGFLLFTHPQVCAFDKEIFIAIDRSTAFQRRMQTKRETQAYFDEQIWPCYVEYNQSVLQRVGQGEDILVLDGVSASPEDNAHKIILFIQNKPIPGRDKAAELSLLQSTLHL